MTHNKYVHVHDIVLDPHNPESRKAKSRTGLNVVTSHRHSAMPASDKAGQSRSCESRGQGRLLRERDITLQLCYQSG